jgi:hypothetical protein
MALQMMGQPTQQGWWLHLSANFLYLCRVPMMQLVVTIRFSRTVWGVAAGFNHPKQAQ